LSFNVKKNTIYYCYKGIFWLFSIIWCRFGIEFTALTEPLCLDQNEYKDLKARLKQDSLYPNFEGITKQYCLGQLRVLSIEQIKLDLEQLTDILKREEIKPRIKNGGALHRI